MPTRVQSSPDRARRDVYACRVSVPEAESSSFSAGVRAGVPFALASCLLALSFGVVARPVMGAVAAVVMSITVFAGSAQFAALAVLTAGGGALPAIVAGILLNLRFVPMGIAIAPWLRHRAWLRAVRGQALVDASWAMASRGDGRFDIDFLLGATAIQYPAWVLGTVAGCWPAASSPTPTHSASTRSSRPSSSACW